MDINISSRGGNSSAINNGTPRLPKTKGFGNFADSNAKLFKQTPTKKQIKRKRQQPKHRTLNYKQNMGKGR